jgi:hypothetical protein
VLSKLDGLPGKDGLELDVLDWPAVKTCDRAGAVWLRLGELDEPTSVDGLELGELDGLAVGAGEPPGTGPLPDEVKVCEAV